MTRIQVFAPPGAVGAHEADTTAVHGIADTAKLARQDATNLFTQSQQMQIGDRSNQAFGPELQFFGTNGAWLGPAVDVAAAIPSRDFVLAAKVTSEDPWQVNDLVYCGHNGTEPPTVGIGRPQPPVDYRLTVQGEDSYATGMGGLLIAKPSGNTPGHLLNLRHSNSQDYLYVDADTNGIWTVMHGSSGASVLRVQDSAALGANTLELLTNGRIQFLANANAQLYSPAADILGVSKHLTINGFLGIGAGIFGSTPIATVDVFQSAASGVDATLKVRAGSNGHLQLRSYVASAACEMITQNASRLDLGTNGAVRARIPAAGGLVLGTAALALGATDGFLYLPSCAGTPSGTPATQTGTVPCLIDTTAGKLWAFLSGSWKSVTFA
jgi:hypothetical protein